MAVLLVVSMGAAVTPATAATTQENNASAEAGAHVDFETKSNAVVNYSVNGQTVVENLTVQSASENSNDGGLDVGVDVGFSASALSLASSLQAGGNAEITTDSGATIEAHDNQRGVMVVRSGGDSQAVQMGISKSSSAQSEGDKRVVVTNDNGSQATVLATGDGAVNVSEDGNVSARTGSNGEVVYRQYEGERSDGDKSQEQMITNGTATAEVYLQQAADSAEDGTERSANVVQYGADTTVDVTQQTANRVNATVDRSQSEGRAVIITVADEAFENAENAEVFVDGEAAVQADSYSEVQSATENGNSSAFLVQQSTSAEATADVVVGINHFSTRAVSLQSEDETTDDGAETTESDDSESSTDGTETADSTDGTDADDSSGDGPGFGVIAALTALLGLALLAGRRL
ncbi:PGF-CTERM sorting domain-containing protein [Halorientalis salina]|uniref:PGF-CTERM sorting domain-containing protein n=1 Tax=Halorientalis salina TaxID=2932266 RepID=UPI00145DE7AB|nr:PGF-CTERM sorting domain-containing protein [Halorientalis salina]